MKLKSLVILSSVLLSGCAATAEDYASLNPGSQFVQDNCKGTFHIKTFGFQSSQRLNIEMLKKDRVGHEYVKVKNGQGVRFFSPWTATSNFTDISCEKKGEALFAKL